MPSIVKEHREWVLFPEDKFGAKCNIKALSSKDHHDLMYAMQNPPRGISGNLNYNILMAQLMLFDKGEQNWEGFLGEDEQEMECSLDNIKLWAHEKPFIEFLSKFQKKVAANSVKAHEDRVKNLLASQNGHQE